ncbi:hypothetical protein OEZ86_005384 [Tetradesmus obliquus]|nr:hypothetical protein OEZ86_005384 [Tetradesmus obliquus]
MEEESCVDVAAAAVPTSDAIASADGATATALHSSNSVAVAKHTGAPQHGSCSYASMPAFQQAPAVARTGRVATDADADGLVQLLEQHKQSLTQDAVGHLLSVKGHMLASLDAAVASEQDAGASRLAAKQAEVDILKDELHATQKQLARTDTHLDRLCDAYAQKQEEVLDTRAQLRAWFVWRCHIARQRRLARQAMQAEQYYVKCWLLGRAWDRWAGSARSRYRQLVTQRAEQEREAAAAALGSTHAQEVAVLRGEIEALQEQLQQDAAARNRMEEDMKRAFMRGVTAINLEAVQMMRRGAPPSGTNPFPAGWVGFESPAANSTGPAVLQQRQSGNGMPRVVVQRGPAAGGGGGRAVGQPRQVAGAQTLAGGGKVSWGPNKR